MKTVTINKVINKKVNDWLKTITDLKLREDLPDNIVITGGCITSMLLKEDPNDYDIYFKDISITKRVADYYLSKMGQGGVTRLTDNQGNFEGTDEYDSKCSSKYVHIYINSSGYLSEKSLTTVTETNDEAYATDIEKTPAELLNENPADERYRPIFITSNAITLSNKIQLIVRFSGDPKCIHSNFDFTHTKMYWTKKDGVVTNVNSLEAVLSKTLIYSGSKFPLCSFIRTRKFINRGWSIDAGQYVKMGLQLSQMDLFDPRTLVQQLIGVDTTYFSWLLDELTKPEHLTDEGKIDNNHAIRLINYMFDSEK